MFIYLFVFALNIVEYPKEVSLKISRRLDLNWPRKVRVEISAKFLTKGSSRGGQAQIFKKKDFKKLEN